MSDLDCVPTLPSVSLISGHGQGIKIPATVSQAEGHGQEFYKVAERNDIQNKNQAIFDRVPACPSVCLTHGAHSTYDCVPACPPLYRGGHTRDTVKGGFGGLNKIVMKSDLQYSKTRKEKIEWFECEEKNHQKLLKNDPIIFSGCEIPPRPPEWFLRDLEWQYRKGFCHAMEEAASLVSKLYRKGGYVRPQEIANIIGEYACDLRKWKTDSMVESPINDHSHPFLKWRPWPEVKKEIHDRDGDSCAECGSASDVEAHHLEPVASGGLPEPDNLVTLCRQCHRGAK